MPKELKERKKERKKEKLLIIHTQIVQNSEVPKVQISLSINEGIGGEV